MDKVTQFYNTIEVEYKVFNYFSNYPNIEDLSESDRFQLSYEYMAMNNFDADTFKERIIKEKNQICKYLQERTENSNNPHLLARYYHLLLICSGNNQYITNAIKYYKEVLDYFLSHIEEQYNIVHFAKVLKTIIFLSQNYRYELDKLKEEALSYLFNKELSAKTKTFILEKIKDSKLFKASEQVEFPQLCIDLLIDESEQNIKERLLKLAIVFSQKTQNTILLKKANELLGDLELNNIKPCDDNNIVIAHQNEYAYTNMINYYKHAGNKEKQASAVKTLQENKKHLKLIKIESKVPLKNSKKINEEIDKLIKIILEAPIDSLLYDICFGTGSIPFISYKMIQESVKEQMGKTFYHELFRSVQVDSNNNKKEIPHEIMSEHQFFQVALNNITLPFLMEVLVQSVQRKHCTYSALKRFLNKTSFGEKHHIERREETFEYSWFSQIDIGLKEFFKQFRKVINNKKTDWRFTIDFFAPKFEAILRDIVYLNGGEITNVKDNGDSSLKLFDDLLRAPILENIFNDDDLFLFRHTFTRVGLNIRNDVAHGILKPFEYGLYKSLLVFICILRLNKVSLYWVKEKQI